MSWSTVDAIFCMRPFVSGARASIIALQQSTESTTDVAAVMRLHLSCLFFLFRLHSECKHSFSIWGISSQLRQPSGRPARNKHESIMLGMRIAPDGICKHSCLLFWRLAIWIFVLAGAMIIGDGASGRSRREKSIFKSTQFGLIKNSSQRARLFSRSAWKMPLNWFL